MEATFTSCTFAFCTLMSIFHWTLRSTQRLERIKIAIRLPDKLESAR